MGDASASVLVYETERPVPMFVADASAIEKGDTLKLADGMIVTASTDAEDDIAGIAAEEKVANDGKTKIPVYRGGIFKMTAKAAFTVGQAVSSSADANKVQAATKTSVGSKTLGLALETSGGDNETVLVELNPGCNNTAYA
jgi:hypothetical protein